MTIHVGVIETGESPTILLPDYGSYPTMGRRLFESFRNDLEFTTISPVTGDPLPSPDAYDCYLLMGSEFSANDPFDWIGSLIGFVQKVSKLHIPTVGICFGHQLIAKAMGGTVTNTGWTLGSQRYSLVEADAAQLTEFETLCFHEDQITQLPPSANLSMTSERCINAAISYQQWPCWTIQSHPEFSEDYARALFDYCRGTYISNELADEAIASVDDFPADLSMVRQEVLSVIASMG